MSNLRGFLWSMGRCGTKSILDTINACTTAEMPSWVDTAQFVNADYFLRLYSRPLALVLHMPQDTAAYEALLRNHRHIPGVLTVRDPIPNLKSYAKVFKKSFVGRQDRSSRRNSRVRQVDHQLHRSDCHRSDDHADDRLLASVVDHQGFRRTKSLISQTWKSRALSKH